MPVRRLLSLVAALLPLHDAAYLAPAMPRSSCRTTAARMALATPEATKLFGRMAEPQLYLDKAVGACCHSACSDCEWRDPEGGYRFDLLKSTFPKWLPCYLERDFEDERGCHKPTWASVLFPDGGSVSRAEFAERFVSLEFAMPMGPKGTIKADADEPSAEAIDALWIWLCDGDESQGSIDAATALKRYAQ